jgi:hypothetical protein
VIGAAADSKKRSFSDPVLLFWYQEFSGARGKIQVFMVKFGNVMVRIWALQGLSTAVLHSGWKSPPHPQNTSAVVENLKYRLGSTGSLVFPKQTDPKRDPKSRPDRSKAGPKKNQIVRNILSSAPFILDFYFKFPIFFKFPTTADVILRMKSWYQNRRTGSEQMRN